MQPLQIAHALGCGCLRKGRECFLRRGDSFGPLMAKYMSNASRPRLTPLTLSHLDKINPHSFMSGTLAFAIWPPGKVASTHRGGLHQI
jgi:hypothetical protein